VHRRTLAATAAWPSLVLDDSDVGGALVGRGASATPDPLLHPHAVAAVEVPRLHRGAGARGHPVAREPPGVVPGARTGGVAGREVADGVVREDGRRRARVLDPGDAVGERGSPVVGGATVDGEPEVPT